MAACSHRFLSFVLCAGACAAQEWSQPVPLDPSAEAPMAHTLAPDGTPQPAVSVEHGSVEVIEGIRVVRLWGTAVERGRAHGRLLAEEIVALANAELGSRFAGPQGKLKLEALRRSVPRLIGFPEAVDAELDGLLEGVRATGCDTTLEAQDRPLDRADLSLIAALDALGVACSGFTVWGKDVDGGGVLSARNFDWPLTGSHLVDNLVLMVHYPDRGQPWAAAGWPGYVGAVTGVSAAGHAVYLHTGDGSPGIPRPESWPTAIAAREILARGADGLVDAARDVLAETAPSASYITRVVLPEVVEAAGGFGPVALFEVDLAKVGCWRPRARCVVTNHFQGREGVRAAGESLTRHGRLDLEVARTLDRGPMTVAGAWAALDRVGKGSRRFGTLHSLVYRAQPWVFELRVGVASPGRDMVPATRSTRRFALDRDQLFAPPRSR